MGGGETNFLGNNGRIYPNGPQRRDFNFTWNVGVNYTMNQHFKATLAYDSMRNWSNFSAAEFPSDSLTLTLTSRW